MNKRHVRAAIAACFSAAQDHTAHPSHHTYTPHPLSPCSLLSFCGRCIEICCLPGAGSQSIAKYAMRIMCVKAKISPIANGEGHKDTHTHTYRCKQMHPHKQLNSCPNCWWALITHTPHVPSSSLAFTLVCHNFQLATSICDRSCFKYALA